VILVVCALAAELSGFVAGKDVALLSCGIGPVEAAAATAQALATRRYDAVISAGIAGVFRDCGQVGDAYVLEEEIFSEFGWEDDEHPDLPNDAQLVTHAYASPALVERARTLPYRITRGLTVTRVTTTNASAARLRETYNAEIESMEGFAVLRTAQRANIPAIGVRGISNIVGDRREGKWDFQAGSQAAVAALTAVLTRISPPT
jgi:futalosine hydrolase